MAVSDNTYETYLKDMNSKYVYPNVFMSIDDTNKVSQLRHRISREVCGTEKKQTGS